jgi:hypothetical protein
MPEENSSDQAGNDVSAVMHALGSVAGSTTLIAALLFCFGWARTEVALRYFGIDVAIAHLSINDLVLRSVDVTVRPLAALGLASLALFGVHRWLAVRLAARGPVVPVRVAVVVCTLGIASCIAAVLGFFNWVVYSTVYPFVPILLAAGVLLVGYGFHIRKLAEPATQSAAGWNGSS